MKRILVVAALCAASLLAVAAESATKPSCLTVAAQDGREPICNPYAASDWAMPHRNAYEQDSTPYAGPVEGTQLTQQHVTLPAGALPFLQFSPPYADGGRAAWFSMVSNPDAERVGKIDATTGTLIDLYDRPLEGAATPSGAYNVLDHAGRFIVGKGNKVNVYTDSVNGDRSSTIQKLLSFTLPPSALCGADDKLVGIILTWNGYVAFATQNGVVGVFPDDPAKMDADHVRTMNITPRENCDDPSKPKEEVSNSIAADENGGIYTVTSAAQYKHVWRGRRLRQAWRVALESDGLQGGIRIGPGSGSSPTLMGTARDDDKLVVVTDGRQVMHLIMMWRDEIPKDWQPIAPGMDPRIVCDVPVDFGDPTIAKAQSEQSVAVRGWAAVVVNNSLKDTSAFDGLPGSLRYQAATLNSGDPANAAHGVERIDWDPATRTCSVKWINAQVSIPNAIPTLSSGSNMFYAIGARNGIWGLEGLDMTTGESRLRVETGANPTHNSFYADTQIAPDGTVWTGTFGGVDILRPAEANAPLPLRCVDRQHTRCRGN
jgi:hypothetical protein